MSATNGTSVATLSPKAKVATLDLPTDRPRREGRAYVAGRLAAVFPRAIRDAVVRLGDVHEVTPDLILFAALNVLLYRYTRQTNLVVGVASDLGTRVVQTDLSRDPPFSEILGHGRELDEDRPVQVVFSSIDDEYGTAELAVTARSEPDGLALTVGYDAGLYDSDTIQRFVGHYRMILEGAVSRPEQRVSALPLLTEAERREIVVTWNETGVDFGNPDRVHHLFEHQAGLTPDAVAVMFHGECRTYRELDRAANALARSLRQHGVGRETLVGLCTAPDPAMLVGLLGILKAGGAYVPLDPSYPAERLAYMLADTSPPVVVLQRSLMNRLPATSARLVFLDDIGSDDEVGDVTDGDLMCVLYTSGSEGKPKGVMITHQGIWNHLRWRQSAYPLTDADRVLHKASICFDVSIWEILLPLVTGARVVIAPPDVDRDSEALVRTIAEWGVTVVRVMPALFRSFLNEPGLERCGCLRLVRVGGESLTAENLALFFARSRAKIATSYGPAEASICVTDWTCQPGPTRPIVPIGRPIANTRIYLLDPSLRPVPVGVPGEIFIGGAALARGYLNRTDLTAERFIPDPFACEPEGRLYRTGDLARFLPDGNIELRGRIDDQMRIRGVRVEPGEVELALNRHPRVRESAVTSRVRPRSGTYLTAFLVADEPRPTVEELRRFLKTWLTDQATPTAYRFLEALPRLPNGKVDRQAFPCDEPRWQEEAEFRHPRTSLEEELADLWAEVMSLSRVGVHDDFFAIGGDSLLATQIVSRVRREFGLELSLKDFFASTTVAGLAAVVETRRWADAPASGMPDFQPVSRDQPLPLSFAQERLWFFEQYAPESWYYHIHFAYRMRGPLDVQAFQESLDALMRRHEVLRTAFPSMEGGALLKIAHEGRVPFRVVPLDDCPEGERGAEILRRAAEELRDPFDLGRGPLIRASLLRFGDADHGFLLTIHHIIFDGWSFNVFVRELAAIYRAFRRGHAAPLPELRVQYADFAAWQRDWLRGEVLDARLAYWLLRLRDLPRLALPTDRPRPAIQSYRGATLNLDLPTRLTEALESLSQREGVTLFMILLAAFQTLLSRYTGQDDIAVGSPIANRNRAEVEEMIGMFVNMLVLRTDLAGDPTFRQLLSRVKEDTLGAFDHQDMPFEKLVEVIRPERDLGRNPLFQVCFALKNPRRKSIELEGLELEPLEPDLGTTQFDLEFYAGRVADGLHTLLVYNTDLFEVETARRFLGHFQTLLEGIVANPDERLSDLPLLTLGERSLLLDADTNFDTDFGMDDRCVHDLFRYQARKTPQAIAVVTESEEFTYDFIERRTNALAHYLCKRGVRPGDRVGICLGRSASTLVATLATLKAGAAYIGLDPAYPPGRLALMLQDSRPAVLLTLAEDGRCLPDVGITTIRLDTDWPEIAREPETAPNVATTADDLAYILYTSGSTGHPKGVQIPHRGVAALIDWGRSVFSPEELAGVLASTSIAFDLSVFEMFLPLSCGGSVIVARNVLALADLPAAGRVTLINTVPSAMAELVRLGEIPESVRIICLAGEALSRTLADRVYRLPRVRRLFNLYGPTESTVYATFALVDRDGEGPPPIGRPIAGTRGYVLDAHRRLVPIGVPGELYLGGKGLARGYLGRPALTAERFVASPFDPAGEQLYRTGDLVRRRSDGAFEYLGRLDHQVKVRGYRIELGEVEAALQAHPTVREVVALVREDLTDDKCLVAYLVTDGEPPPSCELRQHLADRLPAFMVPSAFVPLESLPRTPNGKVDRARLPAPSRGGHEVDTSHVAPRTPDEQYLAAIWCQVLGRESVGATDNFFELGGHSLLAVRLVSRIEAVLGRPVPLNVLFQNPTLERLAKVCGPSVEDDQIPARTRQPLIALGGLGAVIVGSLGERPVYGFDIDGFEVLCASSRIETVARDTVGRIRGLQPDGPYVLAGYSAMGVVAFEVAQQLLDQGERVELLILIDATAVLREGGALHQATRWERRLSYYYKVRHNLMHLVRLRRGEWLPYLARKTRDFLDLLASDIPGLHRILPVKPYLLAGHVLARYRPRDYPGRIAFFVSSARVDRAPDQSTPKWECWREMARGGFEIHVIPGDHKTIFDEPNVEFLRQELRECLATLA
jgi:amino acid adenylation domain-containing protein